jgi:hypothetical protein
MAQPMFYLAIQYGTGAQGPLQATYNLHELRV